MNYENIGLHLILEDITKHPGVRLYRLLLCTPFCLACALALLFNNRCRVTLFLDCVFHLFCLRDSVVCPCCSHRACTHKLGASSSSSSPWSSPAPPCSSPWGAAGTPRSWPPGCATASECSSNCPPSLQRCTSTPRSGRTLPRGSGRGPSVSTRAGSNGVAAPLYTPVDTRQLVQKQWNVTGWTLISVQISSRFPSESCFCGIVQEGGVGCLIISAHFSVYLRNTLICLSGFSRHNNNKKKKQTLTAGKQCVGEKMTLPPLMNQRGIEWHAYQPQITINRRSHTAINALTGRRNYRWLSETMCSTQSQSEAIVKSICGKTHCAVWDRDKKTPHIRSSKNEKSEKFHGSLPHINECKGHPAYPGSHHEQNGTEDGTQQVPQTFAVQLHWHGYQQSPEHK